MWQLIVLYTDRNVLLECADSTFRIYKKRKSSSPKRLGTTGHSVTPGKIVIITLTFSMWHFKCQFSALTTALFKFQCQVSAVTRALFNLNAQCLTPFLFLGGGLKGFTIKGQCCPVCILKVNCCENIIPLSESVSSTNCIKFIFHIENTGY